MIFKLFLFCFLLSSTNAIASSSFEDEVIINSFVVEHDVDAPLFENDRTQLHMAVVEGNFSQIEFLLSKGANVNIQDASGESPIDLAKKNGFASIVKRLKNFEKMHPKNSESLINTKIESLKPLKNSADPVLETLEYAFSNFIRSASVIQLNLKSF